jgi:hypothetical protein
MAWTAKTPAAASASQSDSVSFFILILLEFGGPAASQSGVRSVNCDEFAFNDIRRIPQGVIELKLWYLLLVTAGSLVKRRARRISDVMICNYIDIPILYTILGTSSPWHSSRRTIKQLRLRAATLSPTNQPARRHPSRLILFGHQRSASRSLAGLRASSGRFR